MSDEVTTNETETKAPKSAEEKRAAANTAAQKTRAKIKEKGRVALQQWVPESARDDLREFLKLAVPQFEAGSGNIVNFVHAVLAEEKDRLAKIAEAKAAEAAAAKAAAEAAKTAG